MTDELTIPIPGHMGGLNEKQVLYALRSIAQFGRQAAIALEIERSLEQAGLSRSWSLTSEGFKLLDKLGGPFPKVAGPVLSSRRYSHP